MLILFGFKTAFRDLSSRLDVCRFCGQKAQQRVVERANRFTLFFIPVFTTSRKYQVSCANCGGTTEISREQKDAMAY